MAAARTELFAGVWGLPGDQRRRSDRPARAPEWNRPPRSIDRSRPGSAARVEQLIEDIDQTYGAGRAYFAGAPVSQTAPWYVPSSRSPDGWGRS